MNCMVFYLFGKDLLAGGGGGEFNGGEFPLAKGKGPLPPPPPPPPPPPNINRFILDKSNGHINHRFAAIFNDWVNK
jgi:hypothetical protein